MIVRPTAIPGVHEIDLEPRTDERGSFTRVYCEREFASAGLAPGFVQSNVGRSIRAGTLRGLHHQLAPGAETKVVRCSRGSVFDVVVDLRPDSLSYRRWHGARLTPDGPLVYVPAGCAHGYLTLTDDTEVTYLTSAFYAPALERGVHWADPAIGIDWPAVPLVVSERDAAWTWLDEAIAP